MKLDPTFSATAGLCVACLWLKWSKMRHNSWELNQVNSILKLDGLFKLALSIFFSSRVSLCYLKTVCFPFELNLQCLEALFFYNIFYFFFDHNFFFCLFIILFVSLHLSLFVNCFALIDSLSLLLVIVGKFGIRREIILTEVWYTRKLLTYAAFYLVGMYFLVDSN